jgi:hypothetical protein
MEDIMRRLIVLFALLLPSFLLAQNVTSYYEIKLRSGISNRLLSGRDVDLYQGGSKVYDLAESSTTAGVYSHSSVAPGEYDVWVGGAVFKSGIYIGANKLSIVADNHDSNGYLQGAAVDALEDSLASRDLLVDNGTLQWLAGKINIKDASIGSSKLVTSAVANDELAPNAVTTDKILDNTIDWNDLDSGVQSQINAGGGGGFAVDSLGNWVLTTKDTSAIDISAFAFATPPNILVVARTNWPVWIKSISAAQVVVALGQAGAADTARFDLYFKSND